MENGIIDFGDPLILANAIALLASLVGFLLILRSPKSRNIKKKSGAVQKTDSNRPETILLEKNEFERQIELLATAAQNMPTDGNWLEIDKRMQLLSAIDSIATVAAAAPASKAAWGDLMMKGGRLTPILRANSWLSAVAWTDQSDPSHSEWQDLQTALEQFSGSVRDWLSEIGVSLTEHQLFEQAPYAASAHISLVESDRNNWADLAPVRRQLKQVVTMADRPIVDILRQGYTSANYGQKDSLLVVYNPMEWGDE